MSVDKPNILLFMSDQHHPRITGHGGDLVVRTPALDRLAAEGVDFRHTYCGSPLCVPSRMSFLTSRYPSDIDVWTNQCELASTVPTFAHALSVAGYDTILCGRMHFNGHDQHHGFNRRLVGDVSGARADDVPLFEGVIPEVTTGQSAPGVKVAGPGRSTYLAYDDAVTERACRTLAEIDRAESDEPFCMVVGYLAPHSPYICPRPLYDEYMDKITLPQLPEGYHDDLHPAMVAWRAKRQVDTISPEESRRARAAYYGLVTYLDGCIDQVLQSLAATSFAQETVIIYLSDHGDMAGEHGMWWKSSFYEGSVGVPMIWSWPGHFVADRQVDSVTSLLDVGPTLLDLVGGCLLPDSRGRSLIEFLEGGQPASWSDRAISELYIQGEPATRMIRQGPWKLSYYHGYATPQLFHVENDLDEFVDLGSDMHHAELRALLTAQVLDGWPVDQIVQRIDERARGRAVVQAWQQRMPVNEDERWSIPAGCNIFPEPAAFARQS